MVQLDLAVSKVRREVKVEEACPEIQDLQERKDHRDPTENLVLEDQSECLVGTVHPENGV